MKAVILMVTVFLYVDRPVCTLQFDLNTSGQVTVASTVQKQVSQASIGGGKTRVIIFGLNQVMFSGHFASVNGVVSGTVTNVVGSDANGNSVPVNVKYINQPKNVKVTVTPKK